ncbi:uncharacterized protein LOC141855545 isoform X1 [Brevipalpus obovatus]|uniref:uncharacterized protein LOC141855545 isoform X1 n=1 Tax=Brevipalpus obovatus TaxID=246614 RepID=UPI003D9F1832
MISKLFVSCFLLASIFSACNTTPVGKKKDLCDKSVDGTSQGSLKGINQTESTTKLKSPKSLGKGLHRSFDDDQTEGINLETNLNLCEESHGTVMQTLAEDNSQLTVFETMFREQSNENIKNSDLEENDLVLFVPVN